MTIARRIWSEDTPFDFDGEFFRYEGAFSSVKPVTPAASLSSSREPRLPPLKSAPPKPTSTPSGRARAAVAARMETIDQAAQKAGRKLRYSFLFAPSSPTRGGSLGEGRVDCREDRGAH